MLKSIAIVSAVAAAAYAQSNPLIPSGISDGCRTFLNALDTNTQVASCTSALNTALGAFSPGNTGSPSAADVTSALNDICSTESTSACSPNVISAQVTAFYSACSAELTSNPNPDVVRDYDILYAIVPMQKALCSKNDEGNWCVMSGNPLDGSASDLQSSLYTTVGQTIIPNSDAFASNNIPFLLISPSYEKDALCTACTRNVLSAYISYQSDVPYAPGLGQSQLLSKQADLFKAVQEKCGAKFMDNEVKAAAGLGTGGSFLGSSGAAPSVDVGFQSLMAVFAGFMTLAVSTAL